MAKKYQKFGFRRDRNLSDARSKTQVLNNILNNLPTVQGETYDSYDLYAVKGITNTNIDNETLKSFAGITDLYTDADNIDRPIAPLITLKDRIDNFKVFTGDPLYGTGGDGLVATFIPSTQISNSITNSTIGSDLYTSGIKYGPYRFWDNGTFKFDNTIFEKFTDGYGMIQWVGYFARRLLIPTSTYLNFATTGNILIEENIDDINNPLNPAEGWTILKSIYSKDIPLTVTGTGVASNTLNVGSTNIKHVAIGQSILQHSGIMVTGISGTTITLSGEITVPASPTTLNFTFDIGSDTVNFVANFTETFENDKIKIRITLWWPTPSPIKIYNEKYLQVDAYYGSDIAPFAFFYQNNDRSYIENSIETINYYANNKLSPIKSDTNNDLITTKNMLVKYNPPLIFSDRISYATPATTVASAALGKLTSTGDVFLNSNQGDYVIIRNATPTALVYKIKEKINSNAVFLNTLETFTYAPQVTLAKYSGLVGIFNVTSGVISNLGGTVFDHRLISPDHVITQLQPSNSSAPFLRIKSYNKTTKELIVTNLVGDTISAVSGIVFIYQDKGIEDRSKDVFCSGVIGKLTNGVTSVGSYNIILDDVTGIAVDMYAQFSGYIPTQSKITAVNTITKTIKINKPISKIMLDNSTIVISPDYITREICVIPLDTAFPFLGTESGLETQSPYYWLSANAVEIDKLSINFKLLNGNNDTSKVTTQTFSPNLDYSKTLPIVQNGVIYKLLIV